MTLSNGTRLGPYEILAPIGSGGMGEVYRAKDTRLDRFVAIKVLPEHLVSSADALARFEREAKAVAALNHPNILALHDIGTQDGTAYAVMELLEGESLRARLSQGPLPPRKATELAVQMAQGLAAAHEKGVIHRDLKPENLWITKDGRLKILDFGLAKLTPPEEARKGSQVVTGSLQTGAGTVLGTVAYMSPEQVRGEAADLRSDIFSFGLVLYEMLTGSKAFAQDTAAETMTAILKQDPPEFETGSRPVSPGLQRAVHHCLEKDPAHRFRDAHDLAFALENISSGSGTAAPIAAPFTPRNRWATLVWSAVVALLVLGAALGGWALRRPAAPPSFVPLTHGRGTVSGARFVPGTSEVIYSASWGGQPGQWYTRRTDQPSVRSILGGEGPLLTVSRDGGAMGLSQTYLSHGQLVGRLYSLPTGGGSPRELTEEQAWGCDQGERAGDVAGIFGTYGGEIRIDWPLGHPVYRCQNTLRFLRIRGDQLVAFQEKVGNVEEGNLVLVNRQGKARELASILGFTGLAWGPKASEIWVSTYQHGQSRILAVDLKGRQRVLLQHAGRLELQDVDPEGNILAALHTNQRQTFGRRAGEAADRDLGWLDAQATSGMSEDGTQLLLAQLGDWSLMEGPLYLGSIGGGAPKRLDLEGRFHPWLSADGRWTVTVSHEPPVSMVVAPTGPGTSRAVPLPDFEGGDVSAQLAPGGKTAFIWGRRKGQPFSMYALDLDTSAIRQVSKDGVQIFLFQSWISPDGRWLACTDVAPSAPGAYYQIITFHPDGSGVRICEWLRRGEAIAGWGADSASLIVWDRNHIPAAVEQVDLASGRRTKLLDIFPPDSAGVSGVQCIFVALDGKTYAYNVVRKLSDLYLIKGLK